MKYNKNFVIAFADHVRVTDGKTTNLFEPFEKQFSMEYKPEETIYTQVLQASAEMCSITMDEINSGHKYGDIPTCKQITSKILSELNCTEENISKNIPALGKRGTVHSQIRAAGDYEKVDKTYRVVLNQMRSRFSIIQTEIK